MARKLHPIRAWVLPEAAPVPTGQAAALRAALDQEVVRTLGALPLLLPIFERLGLREVVNRRCAPSGASAQDLDLGLVTLVLVANRLVAPQPLVHVETWLGQTALAELLGVDAARFNDDRLARTLDMLAPHLDGLWQDLIVAAVTQFELDLSLLCYDLTSFCFCGDYDGDDLVTYGYSRDHRPDRKQLELASTVTGVGGVPIDYWVLAGNVADRTTPVANLRRLQGLLALLPPLPQGVRPLVVSDRAMLPLEALAAYDASTVRYLGPLDPGLGGGAVRALLESVTVEDLAAAPLAYRPQRAHDDPDWVAYQGVPRSLELPHPDPAQPPLHVRALVVCSPGKARLDAGLRATHLRRLDTALTDLAKKVGHRPYTTVATVERRLATIVSHHPARRFVAAQVTGSTDSTEGMPLRLTWMYDAVALAAAAEWDGRYVLGTNDPDLDPDQMLARSKLRDVPEKRFATTKGPLAVRPVYLHKHERILGLAFCTLVALLVFALLELLAHRAGLPQSGTVLLHQFASVAVLVLVLRDGSILRRITGLAPPLLAVLDALGLPPAQRYLVTQP